MATLTSILMNKYLYILLFLVVLNTLIKIYDRFPYVKKDDNYDEYLHALDNYYVGNIYYEIFILINYILSYFGVFLLLRLKVLGKELNIMTLSIGNLNLDSMINILLFILCIIFYVNIINTLFYPNLVKLHYYLYQFEWYENIIDRCHMKLHFLSNTLYPSYSYISRLIWSKEDFDHNFNKMLELKRIVNSDSDTITQMQNKHNQQKRLRSIINSNILFFFIVKFLENTLGILELSLSRMLHSISYPILLIVLLWEIHNGKFYYIYFALFIYFITVWIRKIRYFLSVRDPLEKAITDYFYANEIPYTKIKELLETSDIIKVYNNLGNKTKVLLLYKDEIIPYILNNFVVYHVRYPTRRFNEKYLNNNARRSNFLIMIFLGIIYYYLNSLKYISIIFGMEIKLYLLLIPLFVLQYVISKKILYDTQKTSEEAGVVLDEHKCYKNLFRMILLFMGIPMLYIMLKNKVTVFPNEVIFEIKDYIKITEIFSILEKIKYLQNYLDILTKIINLEEELKFNVMLEIKSMIDENITLEEIRNKVEAVLTEVNKAKTQLTLAELLLNYWEKMKTIFSK